MLFARRDIEAAGAGAAGQDESPAAKRGNPEAASGARPTLTRSETVAAAVVLALFVAGIFCIFLAAPLREFGQILRLPRSLADVRLLKVQEVRMLLQDERDVHLARVSRDQNRSFGVDRKEVRTVLP